MGSQNIEVGVGRRINSFLGDIAEPRQYARGEACISFEILIWRQFVFVIVYINFELNFCITTESNLDIWRSINKKGSLEDQIEPQSIFY